MQILTYPNVITMSTRRRARMYLEMTDFRQWTRAVDALAYQKKQGRLDKAVTIEKIDELIKKGEELKRESKIGYMNKYIQSMLILKRIRREMESKPSEGK